MECFQNHQKCRVLSLKLRHFSFSYELIALVFMAIFLIKKTIKRYFADFISRYNPKTLHSRLRLTNGTKNRIELLMRQCA